MGRSKTNKYLTEEEIKNLQEIISRKRRTWTKEEDAKLLEAIKLGATPQDIYKAGILPNRTCDSIWSRYYRLIYRNLGVKGAKNE